MAISKTNVVTQVNVKFDLPAIYPDTTFVFPMRLMLSREMSAAHQEFVGLSDAERDERQHAHNVDQLSGLLVAEPEGFSDFPTADPLKQQALAERVREYFINEEMKHIVHSAMSRYWNAVLPRESL